MIWMISCHSLMRWTHLSSVQNPACLIMQIGSCDCEGQYQRPTRWTMKGDRFTKGGHRIPWVRERPWMGKEAACHHLYCRQGYHVITAARETQIVSPPGGFTWMAQEVRINGGFRPPISNKRAKSGKFWGGDRCKCLQSWMMFVFYWS